MKRKILGLVLALSMLMAFMPTIASAAESGTCGANGDNVTWTLDDNGTLTISGTGDMADYDFWNSYSPFYNNSNIKSIVIGNSVTSIGDCAFDGCGSLVSITIPNSVTNIGDYAFKGCTSLASITIPDSVTSIGYDAFDGTAYYRNEANWEYGVLYIGNHLIAANYEIDSEYTVKNGTKTIGTSAFYCCGLTSITIPDSVTSIGVGAFFDCWYLTSVTIPDSVTSIGYSAFNSCYRLTSITIPNSVTSIERNTFNECNKLTDVYYSGTETQWKATPVDVNNDALTNATIHYNYIKTTPNTYTINDIQPTSSGVELTVQTNENVSGKQTVMVATYDENGVFIGLEQQQITASDTAQTIRVEIDKTNTKTVKAFIWNALGYMMPASRVQSLEL